MPLYLQRALTILRGMRVTDFDYDVFKHISKPGVLDEAHRYLGETNSCSNFTTSIVSLICQQRHFGIRTVIATQEPTVIPHAILGLASSLIIHRLSSPAWAQHLFRNICTDDEQGLGEAMVVAPSGLGVRELDQDVVPFLTGFIVIRTRPNLTLDGGFSITACDQK
ncbi:hypothetical protein DFH28DRAFT_926774 [Melampsora americana]|nr:hypothetical protein DFH28DRAFT_926774 [Melampsora americana]